jgi:hypothetical protein
MFNEKFFGLSEKEIENFIENVGPESCEGGSEGFSG